jgi:hypothetical protein
LEKRDLLLHYDEASEQIIFYSVSLADSAKIKDREFGGASISTSFLKELEPSEAEQKIGRSVLTLLDYSAAVKVKVRDYESLINEEHSLFVAELEKGAAEGNAESQYLLFMEFHSKALKEASLEHLSRAEQLLVLSASNGYSEAAERLVDGWPLMKNAILRKIERNKKA